MMSRTIEEITMEVMLFICYDELATRLQCIYVCLDLSAFLLCIQYINLWMKPNFLFWARSELALGVVAGAVMHCARLRINWSVRSINVTVTPFDDSWCWLLNAKEGDVVERLNNQCNFACHVISWYHRAC